MAYSSVRVQFEIGHEASVRTKKTPEGFTHDWEVFVRGADNTDIQCFVDKIVFHLHETFPKPRRVIKDPPYLVKESGYAGFVLPIDVYLKNKEEPKKISFQYDLTLQPSGPPISRVLREPRLFQNPSEDFRRKLIRGGGVGVDTPETQPEDIKSFGSNQNKTKLSESSVKKHKPELTTNHSFAELFGTPIRRVQDPKKVPELPKKISEMDLCKEKKKSIKVGPYKEEKELLKEKEKISDKEKTKEREKSKEKPSKKLFTSPLSMSQTMKPRDENKKYEENEKKKEDHSDKKKKKDDRDKREKDKDGKEPEKDKKKEKKESIEGDYLKKSNPIKPLDVKSFTYSEKLNNESLDNENVEKEKHRHRHKKKEKEKNRDREKHKKDKEKGEKDLREKDKEKERKSKKKHEDGRQKEEKSRKKSRSPSPSPVQEKAKKGPLNALLDELGSSDSASPLSEEDSAPTFKSPSKISAKNVPEVKSQPLGSNDSKLKSANLNFSGESRIDKEMEKNSKSDVITEIKTKKEKKSRKSEKDSEKKKTKEEQRGRSCSTDTEEPEEVKEDQEKESFEEERSRTSYDKENRKRKKEKSSERHTKGRKAEVIEKNDSGAVLEFADPPEELRRSDRFTKEYVAQLRDLQHRIMTLEDNAELQKVVKVIAETGQYEITKKTFDFDLCALDSDTIVRLQQFFGPT